jgi:hypothetical protein
MAGGEHKSSRRVHGGHEDSIQALMFSGLEEILGEVTLTRVLQSTHIPVKGDKGQTELGAVQAALEKLFGGRGGKGLALQAGRCAFNALLRKYGSNMGLLDNDFRMLPTPRRIASGLVKIAQQLKELGAPPAAISETDSTWVWSNPNCMFNGAGESEEPGCTFLMGIVQEYLSWASGGRYYPLEETQCVRRGDTCCIIQINKEVLD